MTKRKLNIAELQEQSFSSVLNSNNKSHLLGGDWIDDIDNFERTIQGYVITLWRASNPEQGKNIKSASVEM